MMCKCFSTFTLGKKRSINQCVKHPKGSWKLRKVSESGLKGEM